MAYRVPRPKTSKSLSFFLFSAVESLGSRPLSHLKELLNCQAETFTADHKLGKFYFIGLSAFSLVLPQALSSRFLICLFNGFLS